MTQYCTILIRLCILYWPVIALSVSRRRALQSTASVVTLIGSPQGASAARGAAELDLEFYLRDLVGGNKPQGNVEPSKGIPVGPPRQLKDPLLSLLLNDNTSRQCVACQALIDTIQQQGDSSSSIAKIEAYIQQRMDSYRSRSSRSFYTAAPWKEEHVDDQYYFDLTAYAFWRTAADLLPVYSSRDAFMRRMGRLLYQELCSKGLVATTKELRTTDQVSITDTIPTLNEVLTLFVDSGFCTSYQLGEQTSTPIKNRNSKNQQQEESIMPLFDELDNEALLSGATVDCLITIQQPATLRASLQITNEQSRFLPDYIGPVVAALFEQALSTTTNENNSTDLKCTWEVFFVDPEYRPNPKDYFPTEQLLQFSITKV